MARRWFGAAVVLPCGLASCLLVTDTDGLSGGASATDGGSQTLDAPADAKTSLDAAGLDAAGLDAADASSERRFLYDEFTDGLSPVWTLTQYGGASLSLIDDPVRSPPRALLTKQNVGTGGVAVLEAQVPASRLAGEGFRCGASVLVRAITSGGPGLGGEILTLAGRRAGKQVQNPFIYLSPEGASLRTGSQEKAMSPGIERNRWTRVELTTKRTTRTVEAFVDGVSTATLTDDLSVPDELSVYFGMLATQPSASWDIVMDDIGCEWLTP